VISLGVPDVESDWEQDRSISPTCRSLAAKVGCEPILPNAAEGLNGRNGLSGKAKN
jgi:hypothetical protein